jgi:hypothetical protein
MALRPVADGPVVRSLKGPDDAQKRSAHRHTPTRRVDRDLSLAHRCRALSPSGSTAAGPRSAPRDSSDRRRRAIRPLKTISRSGTDHRSNHMGWRFLAKGAGVNRFPGRAVRTRAYAGIKS